MPTEIYINSLQYEFVDDLRARRLTRAEVLDRVVRRRANWLAFELGRPDDEERIAAAIDADPHLTTALEPRDLHGRNVGIVVDEAILARLREALSPSPQPPPRDLLHAAPNRVPDP